MKGNPETGGEWWHKNKTLNCFGNLLKKIWSAGNGIFLYGFVMSDVTLNISEWCINNFNVRTVWSDYSRKMFWSFIGIENKRWFRWLDKIFQFWPLSFGSPWTEMLWDWIRLLARIIMRIAEMQEICCLRRRTLCGIVLHLCSYV